MKTSTAFAILAVLAAGTGAVPIGRRDVDPECPCEILNPNKAIDNVHSAHTNAANPVNALTPGTAKDVVDADKIKSVPTGQGALLNPGAGDDGKDVTVSVPHGSKADSVGEKPVTDPEVIDDTTDSFVGGPSAFRLSKPGRPMLNTVGEDVGPNDGSLGRPLGGDDGDKPIDRVLPGGTPSDKVNNAISPSNEQDKKQGDELDVAILQADKTVHESVQGDEDPLDGGRPLDKVLQGDNDLAKESTGGPVEQTVNKALKPSGDSANNNKVVDKVLSSNTTPVDSKPIPETVNITMPGTTDPSTTDKAVDKVLKGDNNSVKDTTAKPVPDTVNDVLPGTGDRVQQSTGGPVSTASDGIVPGSGPIVKDAGDKSPDDTVDGVTGKPVGKTTDRVVPGSNEKVQKATDGPVSTAAEGIVPGSGPFVQDTGRKSPDETLDNTTGKPLGQTTDRIIPGSDDKVQKTADGPLSNTADGIIPGSGPAIKAAGKDSPNDTVDKTLSSNNDLTKNVGGGTPLDTLPTNALTPNLGDIDVHVDASTKPSHSGDNSPSAQQASSNQSQANSQASEPEDSFIEPGFKGVNRLSRPSSSGGIPAIDVLPLQGTDQMVKQLNADKVLDPLSGSGKPAGMDPLIGVLGGTVVSALKQPEAGDLMGKQPVGQVIAPLTSSGRPVGGGVLGSDNSRPVNQITDPLIPSGRPVGNGIPLISPLMGSTQRIDGRPLDPVLKKGGNGLPVINNLAQPQGSSPVDTDSLVGRPGLANVVAPGFLGGPGRTLLGKPLGTDTGKQVAPQIAGAGDPITSHPENSLDTLNNDLAAEGVKACRECVNKAVSPVESKTDDAEKLVESDPLHVEPTAKSPESALPVSYQCVTSPVSNLPEGTVACMSNFQGRSGNDVDVCIARDQLESRPEKTFACPEEMQGMITDDLSLLRRDTNDEEWDILTRGVDRYVRLCMIVNNL